MRRDDSCCAIEFLLYDIFLVWLAGLGTSLYGGTTSAGPGHISTPRHGPVSDWTSLKSGVVFGGCFTQKTHCWSGIWTETLGMN